MFNTKEPPFDDVRVRKALAMAVERDAITEKVLRTGEIPAYNLVPPDAGTYGEPPQVEWADMPYEERVEQAKALLAEAGFGPDNPLRFTLRYNTSENHKKVAIAVAAMWKQLGVAGGAVQHRGQGPLQRPAVARFPGRARRLGRRLQRSRELPVAAAHLDRSDELRPVQQRGVRPADGRIGRDHGRARRATS